MIKWLISYWFKMKGWKFTGTLPKRMKKSVIVVGPHTSRQDFFLGVAVGHLSKFHSRILVNKKYFWFPLNKVLDHLGAYPFDAKNPKATEMYWVNKFNERTRCSVVMVPEIGKSRNDEWDLTFHHLARKTGAPIAMVALDYKNKEVKFHTHFFPTEDIDRDIDFMRNWLSTYQGKNPEQGIFRLGNTVQASQVNN
jgi:1-acyl-sn-glycerol-3-phosphate acyltransferase